MLTKEENDLLTQTGPGTPCGEYMRRYWQPVALAEELPPDGPPVPARALGENLAIFRDAQGRLGLLGRYCSHRGADLSRGFPEPEGLRCFYHGWLYDAQGKCLEQPLEPPESTFHEEVQHPAYPVQERGGIIFAYLGPGEPPLIPDYEFLSVPSDYRRSTKYIQECNYLQGNEGNIDAFQMLFLERILGPAPDAMPDPDAEPELTVEAEATDFGVRLVALRPTGTGEHAVAVRNFLYPSLSIVPSVGTDGYTVHWHVPMDDTHHWRFVITFRREGPISDDEARANGVEATEEYRLVANRSDLFAEKTEPTNYIAYATLMIESQGAIHDRTLEHLGNSDEGLVLMRTAVHKAIQDVQEGADPPHVVRDAEANHFSHIQAREGTVSDKDNWRVQLGG